MGTFFQLPDGKIGHQQFDSLNSEQSKKIDESFKPIRHRDIW